MTSQYMYSPVVGKIKARAGSEMDFPYLRFRDKTPNAFFHKTNDLVAIYSTA